MFCMYSLIFRCMRIVKSWLIGCKYDGDILSWFEFDVCFFFLICYFRVFVGKVVVINGNILEVKLN